MASLTHGLANGIRHFPDEVGDPRARRASTTSRALVAFIRDNGIDCDLEETGDLSVADQPYQVDEFRAWVDEAAEWGEELVFLDRDAVQRGGPLAALAGRASSGRRAGSRRARRPGEARPRSRPGREERGVAIHERHAGRSRSSGGPVASSSGPPTARRVERRPRRRRDVGLLGLAAAASSSQFVPVYDYALVSEPLTPEQRASIGWRRRQGMSDANNQFHYFRLTADDRILWGGYDAIYYPDNGVGPAVRPAAGDVRQARARSSGRAFPQLAAARVPVPLGRRDRHDVAVHGHVRAGARRPADVRPRLHRAGRRREPLGGRASSATSSSARTPTCCGCASSGAAVPVPARAAPVAGRQHGPPRARPGRPERGPPGPRCLRTLDALGIGFDS